MKGSTLLKLRTAGLWAMVIQCVGIGHWVPDFSDFIPRINPSFAHWLSKPVSSLASPNGGCNITLVRDIFIPSGALRILALPPPNSVRQDNLMWCLTPFDK